LNGTIFVGVGNRLQKVLDLTIWRQSGAHATLLFYTLQCEAALFGRKIRGF